MSKNILLVGTVSNVAKTIEKELKVVIRALASFDSIQIFLVESDSTDNTVRILGDIQKSNGNFTFASKGKLLTKFPNRVERIAFCRNVYVRFIRENHEKQEWKYVAVADLDGMNFKLRVKGVDTCLNPDLYWDGVMANQKYGYYDIYALRAKDWVEEDCFKELSRLKKTNLHLNYYNGAVIKFISNFNYYDNLRKLAIYSKMKKLNKTSPLLEVDSAFGGFALYKLQAFLYSDYKDLNFVESEHVIFHRKLKKKGFNFFINPALINNNFNLYNLNKFYLIRLLRELKNIFN